MRHRGRPILVALLSTAMAAAAFAQEDRPPVKPEELEGKSLPLRTALYHDPTLGAPLDRLLEIYRSANRVPDLVEIYRQHVAQYPTDAGAVTVYARLLEATNDANAGAVLREAARRFADNAYLQFLLSDHLATAQEAGALDALDRAITLETLPERKRLWIDKLLPLAAAEGRPELARKHLEALAASGRTAQEKLEVARKQITGKFHEAALATLAAAAAMQPGAETGVEIELAAASAEIGLQRTDAAAARLDRLLARLAPDYWRRTEILHRRTALVKTDAEREKMLAAARERLKKAPGDESAALEVAQLLAAFEFRREALDVLLAAEKQSPGSEKLERAALELFDLLRDERGRESFLATMQKAAPDRLDIALARTRSLFLLGRREEAIALFDQSAPKMDASTRLTQTLELARFLRKSAQSGDAATIFERALALAPERLDVRRELAETWLALGQKDKASRAFTGTLPEGAETESVLDVVQFLLQQGLIEQAGAILTERLAKDPQNFDLRTAQVQLAGRSANYEGGVKLIAELRALSDTTARYRRWLETALAFHELFETSGTFLAEEQARVMAGGDWSGANLERRLAFADAAIENGQKAETRAMLDQALAGDLPTAVRIELRRRQLTLEENDPSQAAAVEEQLKALLKDDPSNAGEYRIRLALLDFRAQRYDEARSVLGGDPGRDPLADFDFQKITSAPLLNGLLAILPQIGIQGALPLLERLTALDPSNRGAWEQWVSALALSGDEDRLRTALRRLLTGIDKMPLSEETRAALRAQLFSSYWRSLNGLLNEADTDPSRLVEALPLLDAVGRLADCRQEWLWINWTRAYTLDLLGRLAARDEVIREIERVAAAPPGKESPDVIAFPDGLLVGIAEARAILTRQRTADPAVPGPAGPRENLRVHWAFETDGRSPVDRIIPLDAGHLLITDLSGMLYSVEKSSGKLAWSRAGGRPLSPTADASNGGYYLRYFAASHSQPVCAADRIYLPVGEAIECWSAKDGGLIWRSGALNARGSLHPRLLVDGGRLLVCDPARLAISALDPANGKLLWQRDYGPEQVGAPLTDLNAGVSFSRGRILLYGAGTVIVDAKSGDLQWRFDPRKVQSFPITISAPSALATGAAGGGVPFVGGGRYFGGRFGGRFGGMGSYPMNWINYQDLREARARGFVPQPGQQLSIAGAATAWSSAQQDQGQPRLGALFGDELLLSSPNGLTLLNLDRPFHTPTVGANGAVIGLTSHHAWLLAPPNVTAVNFDSGKTTTINLGTEAPDGAAVNSLIAGAGYLQAATDGLVIYVSGPRGVSLYHARTGAKLATMPWPKNLAPEGNPSGGRQYVQPVANGFFRQDQNGGATFEPLTATLLDGTFYTTVEPTRVVAIDARTETEVAP
jgi:hypothetical protein